jgi:hypothetical protein
VPGIPQQLGSPGSSVASSPVAGLAAPGVLSGSPQLHHAADEQGASGMPRANSTGGLLAHGASAEQQLRSSLNELGEAGIRNVLQQLEPDSSVLMFGSCPGSAVRWYHIPMFNARGAWGCANTFDQVQTCMADCATAQFVLCSVFGLQT